MDDLFKISASSYAGQYVARLHDQTIFRDNILGRPFYAVMMVALRCLAVLKTALLTIPDTCIAIGYKIASYEYNEREHEWIRTRLESNNVAEEVERKLEQFRQNKMSRLAVAKAHVLSILALPKILLGMPFGYLPRLKVDSIPKIKTFFRSWNESLQIEEREQHIQQLSNIINEFLEKGPTHASHSALVKDIEERYPGLNTYLTDSGTTLEVSLMVLAASCKLPNLVRQLALLMPEQLNQLTQTRYCHDRHLRPRTPLMNLLYQGDIELAKILVESGVDCQGPDIRDVIPMDLFILQKAFTYWERGELNSEDLEFARVLFNNGVRFNRERYIPLQDINTDTNDPHLRWDPQMYVGGLIMAWEDKQSGLKVGERIHLEGWRIPEKSRKLFWDEFIPRIEQIQKECDQQLAQEVSKIAKYAEYPSSLDPMKDLNPVIMSFLQ